MTVLNTFTGKTERISRMVEMHADDRIEIDSAQAGDIVALVGMKNVQTGHTLCDPKNPATLEPMVFPDPVISIAVAPKDKANAEKLGEAIAKMVQEDPSFRVETDEETNETILKGMGELHLDIKIDILKRTHKVEVEVGAPQVAYRETITKPGRRLLHPQEAVRRFRPVRQDRLHHRAGRSRHRFRLRIEGRRRQRAEGIHGLRRKRLPTSIHKGTLAGYPCLDFKVTLKDGGFHAVDSSAIAFEIAASSAYRQTIPKAAPQLLEPIMKIDVFTPDNHVGDVIGDLNRRRGMIKDRRIPPTVASASRPMPRSAKCSATSVTSAP
jgi:elongation factor G